MSLQRKIDVRVHVAKFINKDSSPCAFINVRNKCKRRNIQIKRIYFLNPFDVDKTGGTRQAVEIQNVERPLPVTLKAGKEWETWLKLKESPNDKTDDNTEGNFFNSFLVEVDNDIVLISQQRKGVHSQGEVPNGK